MSCKAGQLCRAIAGQKKNEEQRVFVAEAFWEGRKDQNCPGAPDLDHSSWTGGLVPESSSLSGSAVDLLAEGSGLGCVVAGGRLRLFWGSPGCGMKDRVYGVSQL